MSTFCMKFNRKTIKNITKIIVKKKKKNCESFLPIILKNALLFNFK